MQGVASCAARSAPCWHTGQHQVLQTHPRGCMAHPTRLPTTVPPSPAHRTSERALALPVRSARMRASAGTKGANVLFTGLACTYRLTTQRPSPVPVVKPALH